MLENIFRYYFGIVIVYLLLIIAAIKYMLPATFQITSNYWTSNPLLSQSKTVFVTASHVVLSIQIKWALVFILFLSIIMPLLYIYLIKNNFKKIDLHKYRTVDWLVTGSCITLLLSIFAGVEDLITLVIIFGLSSISYVILWFAINNYGKTDSININFYKVSIIGFILPWLIILVYGVYTIIYGSVRSPWFIYASYIVGIINTLTVIYGFYWHKSKKIKKNIIKDETYPIIFNLFIKLSLALILIIGLKR